MPGSAGPQSCDHTYTLVCRN